MGVSCPQRFDGKKLILSPLLVHEGVLWYLMCYHLFH